MYSYLGLSYLGAWLVPLCIISVHYGATFLALEELTEQTGGSSGCGEVAMVGVYLLGTSV